MVAYLKKPEGSEEFHQIVDFLNASHISQVTLQKDDSGVILISFMIQNEFITLSLQQFGQILIIPFNGQAVFTNEWGLGSLAYSQETKGPYHTDLPTPEEIHQFQRGHWDHLPACLAHILYCILAEQQYNLAYFFVKRIESARATPKAHLPFDMFLTHLFRHTNPETPNDRGKARHSVSSTSAHHNFGSSSRQEDYDEDDGASRGDDYEDDSASRASTPSPTTYLNSLGPLEYQQYDVPTSSEQNDDILFERITWSLWEEEEMKMLKND
ncbi:hypothetical protein Tco_1539649 [Tanacetum coccineum]